MQSKFRELDISHFSSLQNQIPSTLISCVNLISSCRKKESFMTNISHSHFTVSKCSHSLNMCYCDLLLYFFWQSPGRGRSAIRTCRWWPHHSPAASPHQRIRSKTWRLVASPGWWAPGTPYHIDSQWPAERGDREHLYDILLREFYIYL